MDSRQEIGRLAVEMIEQVEADHPCGQVASVGIVVEIVYPGGRVVEVRTNLAAPWVSAGLFRRAMLAFDDERVRERGTSTET